MARGAPLIRRVEPGDAQLVKTIRLRSLQADPLSFGSTYEREAAFDDAAWEDWARDDAHGDEMATFLAVEASTPLGIVGAYRDDDEPGLYHVVAMWVAPEVRRRGLARRLLEEIEGWIVAAGGTEVQLFVTDAAEAAQSLYRSTGYAPDGATMPSRHSPGLLETSLRKSLK